MIDFTKSKQYTLSIRLSTDGFSFSIYNPINDNSQSLFEKEVDTSLSLTANLKNVFHESDFFKLLLQTGEHHDSQQTLYHDTIGTV